MVIKAEFRNTKIPIKKDDNITAIYGMAEAIPDKTIINELVEGRVHKCDG